MNAAAVGKDLSRTARTAPGQRTQHPDLEHHRAQQRQVREAFDNADHQCPRKESVCSGWRSMATRIGRLPPWLAAQMAQIRIAGVDGGRSTLAAHNEAAILRS